MVSSYHRVIVLGDCGCGKSSLVQTMTSGAVTLENKPTDGVEVIEFTPTFDNPFIDGKLSLELLTVRKQ